MVAGTRVHGASPPGAKLAEGKAPARHSTFRQRPADRLGSGPLAQASRIRRRLPPASGAIGAGKRTTSLQRVYRPMVWARICRALRGLLRATRTHEVGRHLHRSGVSRGPFLVGAKTHHGRTGRIGRELLCVFWRSRRRPCLEPHSLHFELRPRLFVVWNRPLLGFPSHLSLHG